MQIARTDGQDDARRHFARLLTTEDIHILW
jgi:hypothetical protein